ncbi:3-deoxy-manno-octulosonate cytidylyltransferase [hydrothermal vent metagenome]|uniref:3-deoxy-manno-octulosonate cytidylyltransferase n=1 Tax=hydrothermal vent metagenome TaxID=652676 RepID=A0A3B0SAL2_9ZZZZ
MSVPPPDSSNTIIIVPSRMASARLPGKPLADICGMPMIVQVWHRAKQAKIGKVLVAAAEDEIANTVRLAGGDAILTDANLPSGSDRVAQALAMRDVERRYEYIVNLQGDLPTIDPKAIRACLGAFLTHDADIATLVSQIDNEEDIANLNVVKAVTNFSDGASTGLATDFVRNDGNDMQAPYWHHIGIYAYRRAALEKFVQLPVSQREKDRSLEQMRALDNGMKIAVSRVDTVPFGVDTPADLERARATLADKG